MRTKHLNLVVELALLDIFKPSSEIVLLTVPGWCFLCGILYVIHVSLTFVLIIPSCLFLVVVCLEGTCLLCVVFPLVLSLSHMVSPVRCGT